MKRSTQRIEELPNNKLPIPQSARKALGQISNNAANKRPAKKEDGEAKLIKKPSKITPAATSTTIPPTSSKLTREQKLQQWKKSAKKKPSSVTAASVEPVNVISKIETPRAAEVAEVPDDNSLKRKSPSPTTVHGSDSANSPSKRTRLSDIVATEPSAVAPTIVSQQPRDAAAPALPSNDAAEILPTIPSADASNPSAAPLSTATAAQEVAHLSDTPAAEEGENQLMCTEDFVQEFLQASSAYQLRVALSGGVTSSERVEELVNKMQALEDKCYSLQAKEIEHCNYVAVMKDVLAECQHANMQLEQEVDELEAKNASLVDNSDLLLELALLYKCTQVDSEIKDVPIAETADEIEPESVPVKRVQSRSRDAPTQKPVSVTCNHTIIQRDMQALEARFSAAQAQIQVQDTTISDLRRHNNALIFEQEVVKQQALQHVTIAQEKLAEKEYEFKMTLRSYTESQEKLRTEQQQQLTVLQHQMTTGLTQAVQKINDLKAELETERARNLELQNQISQLHVLLLLNNSRL